MRELNSKPLQELRILHRSLEGGFVDYNLIRPLHKTLKISPEDLLPQNLGEVCWTAFLMYKNDLMHDAKRIAFVVLAWMQRNSDDADLIESCIRNVQYLFEKEGRKISREEAQRIASEGKFRLDEPHDTIEPMT